MSTRPDPSSRTADPLLHAKLMPPRLPSAYVRRGDLLKRLDEGLTRKLTLVMAPTGYGKTTLVRQWLADRALCAAWLTLDETDNDPVRFWTYAINALRTIDARLGKTALSRLSASQPVMLQPVLTALINDLSGLENAAADGAADAEAHARLLVLEDYHAITSAEIHGSVSFLLHHLPATLHLVLISRHEPSLPLGILRARDELVELDAATLRFSVAETEAFLRGAIHPELPPGTAAYLQKRTDGWAAGLRLAAISLQNRDPQQAATILQAFSGTHPFVADYLMQEVYQNLPAAVQEFVLSTSFLGRLTGSLCDAVTETANSAAILEQLVRENLFMVPLEQKGEPPWYRYHALFAESMQALARTLLGETRLAAILEKASGWYAEHGLSEEAIQTALAARLYPRALSLIEGYLLIHDVSEMRTLARWLEGIPGHELSTHPEICFAYAQVLLFSSPERFAPATAARMEPYAAAAETAWREQSNRARLGALLSFRGIVSWWQGDLGKAFQYARRSLEDLPESEVFWRGNSLLIASQEALNAGRIFAAQDTVLEARALLGAAQNKFGVLAALQLFGECLYWQGDLDQGEAVNQQILTEAVGDESMLDDQGLACLALANTAYERNDLSQAEQFASRSLDLAGQRGNELLRMQASLVQASVEAARGDYTAADSRLKNLAAGAQNPRSLREIREAQSRLALQAGEHPASSGGLSRISLDKGDAPAVLLEREDFTRARLHIARGESAAALEILKGRAAVAAGSGRLRSQVTALALEALAQHAEAGLPQVAKPLVEALQIGQARGFHRLFLDEGRPMSALLQAVLPTLGSRLLSLYATALVHSFDTEMPARPGEPALVEPLSPQEVRVLRLLAAGLSNIDIARELFVSTNTIKTHVKNIYRKLDVRSRGEARALARELKIM